MLQAASSRSDYVLCVDDDVYLHPATLHDIVSSMRDMPKCFMATGIAFMYEPKSWTTSTASLLRFTALEEVL